VAAGLQPADAESAGCKPAASAVGQEPVDLHTLLGQFIAVRHEVNLQTKAVRAQQEQNAEALRVLAGAVESLQRSQGSASQSQQPAAEEQVRPLLKALIDVHDALSLASREAQRVQEDLLPTLAALLGEPAPWSLTLADVETPALDGGPRPLLARLLGVRGIEQSRLDEWQQRTRTALEEETAAQHQKHQATQQDRYRQAQEGVERVRQLLASLVAGYRMGLQRIERALQQNGLEAIPAVGRPFDPERMEVLEAVDNSGRPAGEVLEEVRRGYWWRGRIFRYAQVRVARS
jgi:molecular chaperone GrpE